MLRKPRTAKPPIKASQVGVATSAGGFGSSSHQLQLLRADLVFPFPSEAFSYPEWTLFGSFFQRKALQVGKHRLNASYGILAVAHKFWTASSRRLIVAKCGPIVPRNGSHE